MAINQARAKRQDTFTGFEPSAPYMDGDQKLFMGVLLIQINGGRQSWDVGFQKDTGISMVYHRSIMSISGLPEFQGVD